MLSTEAGNESPQVEAKSATAVWRVLCVDDHPDVRMSLQMLLDGEADMECAGCLPNAETLVEEAKRLRPDVILLDATMPGKDPFDALSELSAELPETPTVIFSAWDDTRLLQRAIECGAKGWVDKCAEADALLKALREVAKGGESFS